MFSNHKHKVSITGEKQKKSNSKTSIINQEKQQLKQREEERQLKQREETERGIIHAKRTKRRKVKSEQHPEPDTTDEYTADAETEQSDTERESDDADSLLKETLKTTPTPPLKIEHIALLDRISGGTISPLRPYFKYPKYFSNTPFEPKTLTDEQPPSASTMMSPAPITGNGSSFFSPTASSKHGQALNTPTSILFSPPLRSTAPSSLSLAPSTPNIGTPTPGTPTTSSVNPSSNLSSIDGLMPLSLPTSTSSASPKTATEAPQATENPSFLPKEEQHRDHRYVVCCLHALETAPTLLDTLIKRGIDPTHIYFTDKMYSTFIGNETQMAILDKIRKLTKNENVIGFTTPAAPWDYSDSIDKNTRQLWEKVEKDFNQDKDASGIIIIDDGGKLIKSTPDRLANKCRAIEQTTRGLWELYGYPNSTTKPTPPKCPVIAVASAPIKLEEAPFVGELVVECVQNNLPKLLPTEKAEKTCGIIGLGVIGKSVAEALRKDGYKVCFYDIDKNKEAPSGTGITKCASPKELIEQSDFVIGCSGNDTLKNMNLAECIKKDTTFMSVSSEAIEFLSPMKANRTAAKNLTDYKTNPDVNLKYTIAGHNVTFLKSGHPITFDRNRPHGASGEKMAPTYAALFAAVLQWLYEKPNPNPVLTKPAPLNINLQRPIIEEWHDCLRKARIPVPQTSLTQPELALKLS